MLRPELSGSGKVLAGILSDAGIPLISAANGADNRFSELAVFLNLISLIENPGGDVELLSVMRYPHFGFTEPELAEIRLAQEGKQEDKSFYYAAANYCGDKLDKKIKGFFSEIERYRRLSQCMKLPDFLMLLRQEAEFSEYALTSPGGTGSDRALSQFINTVSSMKDIKLKDIPGIAEKMGAPKQNQKPGEADAVYLTTIHKAKGLEFPAVILSGMHKIINQRDASGPVLVGRSLGLALDMIDENERTRKPTLHRRAVALAMKRETISETVRLLYVGMTRAKRKLAVLGAGDGIKSKWTESKSAEWQLEASTYFDLLMPAACMMYTRGGRDINEAVRVLKGSAAEGEREDKAKRLDELFNEASTADEENFFKAYAHAEDLGVPSKVSVTALKKMQDPLFTRPQFLPDEQGGISATEKGTLMHKVMQRIGIEAKTAEEVEQSVKDFAQRGIIDEAISGFVDAKSVSAFLNSALAQRTRVSSKCLFEAPFCLGLSADEIGLSRSEENVIVQGVIDLCFLEEGQWVIVDYKTDRIERSKAKEAAQKYGIQLSLYARALADITGMPVKQKYIYFLSSGTEILLP